MVKVHKLVAAIATTITLSTTSAYALNMGEISWKSSYGQPLNARIELSDAAGLRAADIRPSLASPDDFAKSGLDRTSELSNLTFKTVLGENGKGYIQINSTKPIKEPYLNFLLDVNWQGNKISREYTILMDLPISGNANTTVAKPVTSSPVTTPKPVSQPTIKGDTYLTARGDTLWSVADKLRGNSSAAKTATAIYKKNPKAFINGNANHLLAGYTLKAPTSKEINAISVAEATAFLQSTKSPTAVTATKTDVTPTQPVTVDNKQAEQLQTQLESSKQALDNARQENDDLSTQLEQLQAEISRLEELSKQKDSQIEEVKTKLDQSSTKPVVVDETKVDEDAAKKAAEEAAAKKAAEEAAAQKAAQEAAAKQAAAQKAAQEAAARKAAEQAAAQQPAQQPKAPTPVTQDTTPEPSFISSLLGNQLLLMAGGGGLLLICIVALLLRRKKAANDDATVVDLSNVTLDDDDLNDSEQVDTPAISSTETQPLNSPLSQLGEGMGTVDKADIYLAYNHYDEAKELLVNALQEDPTNTEYRLKLMEVYAEQGDVANFETEEQELILLDPLAQHKIDTLKEKYPTLAGSQFNFSSPTTLEESPVTDIEPPVETVFDVSTAEELSDNKEPEVTDISFDFDTLSTPTTEEAPDITQDIAEPEVEQEVIYEPDPTREVDENFELEKITPDSTEQEKPIFDAHLDEETFSSDSPIFDFEKEEAPQEEPKEEDFKFDLGFNSDSEPPLEITDTPQTTVEENVDEMEEIIEKDQVTTKLELVNAYIDMGDTEGAHDLLEEIMREGNDSQQAEARSLLASIGGDNQSSTTDDSTAPIESPAIQENEVVKDEEPSISLVDSAVDTKTSLAELDLGFELPPEDEVSTKLELANAYIEMGDSSGAKDILEEVLKEGTAEQIQQAEQLLASLK
ncbi:FimV/HubP family polar landmark protein [Entomomonas asaccharolytica]|uniref:LysM domain-containing protein n=1 Tax=Entomomonas asaccharolytica TaxID=2785331 RepID=A0A974NGG0_9GAMM|nr:FimV/HubP family polar landmark protein [Entomomonas asaccharolytica]QQP86306.1 hypothetical protein JHT90_03420 [Entomomonas asaccharolytica]